MRHACHRHQYVLFVLSCTCPPEDDGDRVQDRRSAGGEGRCARQRGQLRREHGRRHRAAIQEGMAGELSGLHGGVSKRSTPARTNVHLRDLSACTAALHHQLPHQASLAEQFTTGGHRRGPRCTHCGNSTSRSRFDRRTAARRRSRRSSVEQSPSTHRAGAGNAYRSSGSRLRAV